MTGRKQDNISIALDDTHDIKKVMRSVSEICNGCGLCQKQCEFLRRFGTPGDISDTTASQPKDAFSFSFACSLCSLCTVVCPQGVNPAALFLEMRRSARTRGEGRFSAHKRLLAYEARGISPRYSWYGFPENCNTIFFPGCALPGTRPGQTLALFRELGQHIPSLGIALDCCTKSSHDLGRTNHFFAAFGSLKQHLLSSGIQTVITACPNCLQIFRRYGSPIQVENAYELLSKMETASFQTVDREVAIHDSCAVRFETDLQKAVRKLVGKTGARIVELQNKGRETLCCGEGGAVGHLHPDLSRQWTEVRRRQTRGRHLVTYCAGCAGFLGRVTPTEHILDLLFSPDKGKPFKMKVSRTPFTYWNRLRLKRHFKTHLPAKISGRRPFNHPQHQSRS